MTREAGYSTGAPPTPVEERPGLRVSDRCDRCVAQAFVRVVFVGGGELLFCKHHYERHELALLTTADHIQDERDRLKPSKHQDMPEGQPQAQIPKDRGGRH